MVISTAYAQQQSPKLVAYLLAFYSILSITGCVTVDLGEHDVSPEVQSELQTPFTRIDVTAVNAEIDPTPVLQALTDKGIEVVFVDSTVCSDESIVGKNTHVSLDKLLQSDSMVKVARCDIDLIIVVGRDYRNNETNLAVSIVDYNETDKVETLHIHAEGNVRGFLPAPVPYLSLFYFVSTPDTEGSAIDSLAEAIANKIEVENYERPVRLLYLRSDNLLTIAKQLSQNEDMLDSKDDDTEMSRYNPLYFYVQMNKEAAEEGNPFVHNPLGQLQLLVTSILASPFIIVLDAVFGPPDQATSATVTTVTAEEESTMADATDAINRHDWEAGYRALEGCLHSRNTKVRKFCLYQINTHPELRDAAKQTFSESALRQSKASHGDSAQDIESHRIAIYENITTKEDLTFANLNMHKAFPSYQNQKEQALKVLQKRATEGNPGAQWEFYKFSKSRGDHDFKWLCAAAEQGDYRARWELGYIYSNGLYGARKDLVQSVMWYSLVEADGHNPTGVDNIRAQLTSEQLTEAEYLYHNWKPGQCEREIFGSETFSTH